MSLYNEINENIIKPNQERLRKILNDAMELSGAEEGGVITRNSNTGELRVEHFVGYGVNNKHRILDSDPQQSISAFVASTQILENIIDVRKDSRFHAMSDSQVLSEIIVPVIYDGECIGIINLESIKLEAFSPQTEILLTEYSNNISSDFYILMVESKNYYLSKQSESVNEITAYTLENAEITDEEKVLQMILDHSLNLTDADMGGILILSEDREYLDLKVSKGVKNTSKQYRIKRGDGICWKAVNEDKVLNVWNIQEYSNTYEDISSAPINSELAVPLQFQGKAIGVINVESTNFNAFGFDHVNTLTKFSQQVAILYHLLLARKKWEGAWAVARWGDLSNNLAHRMNNLIGGVGTIAKRISRKTENNDIRKYAKTIEVSTNEALNVLEDYSTKFDWTMEPINVGDVVNKAVNTINLPKGIEVKIQTKNNNVQAILPKTQFVELVRELVSNSGKYMESNGIITVTLTEQWGVIMLDVNDTGRGFDTKDIHRLLELGERGSGSSSVGTGYGLWWVKHFVNATGGDVKLSNNRQGGASVRVTIPSESYSK